MISANACTRRCNKAVSPHIPAADVFLAAHVISAADVFPTARIVA